MDTLNPVIEWAAAILIVVGAFFLLVGAIGMVRLPDFYMRLHAPTKSSTLGVGGVLLASLLLGWAQGRPGLAELLITLFVFVTAPVSANLLAQAALHLRLPSRAPVPTDAVPERTASMTMQVQQNGVEQVEREQHKADPAADVPHA